MALLQMETTFLCSSMDQGALSIVSCAKRSKLFLRVGLNFRSKMAELLALKGYPFTVKLCQPDRLFQEFFFNSPKSLSCGP